jgi:hypothetical protein
VALLELQESRVEVKLKIIHECQVYADDVNLLGDNIDTIKKNTRTCGNIPHNNNRQVLVSRKRLVDFIRYHV